MTDKVDRYCVRCHGEAERKVMNEIESIYGEVAEVIRQEDRLKKASALLSEVANHLFSNQYQENQIVPWELYERVRNWHNYESEIS